MCGPFKVPDFFVTPLHRSRFFKFQTKTTKSHRFYILETPDCNANICCYFFVLLKVRAFFWDRSVDVVHLPAFVTAVADPASPHLCTCCMSVPSQQRRSDGFSCTSCFHLTANPALNFTWSVLIYYTLMSSTKGGCGSE